MAFVEYENIENAQTAIELTAQSDYKIWSNRVYFSFTSRDKISNDMDIDIEHGWVLLISITNIKYPVSIEILNKLFSWFGEIQKIIMFQR